LDENDYAVVDDTQFGRIYMERIHGKMKWRWFQQTLPAPHVVGLDRRGAIVLRQKWSRGQVEARLAAMPPCLIGMEACVGAHHLSRKLQGYGHDARLMPAKYVRAYSKGQKNDFRDAEAIAEAVQRPTMKFVATKTADQLDLQALHRVRERLVRQRTSIINQIRAFLLERGVAVRQGRHFLRTELQGILAKRSDVLSPRMMRIIEDLAGDWRRLDERIEGLSTDIASLVDQDPACRRSERQSTAAPRSVGYCVSCQPLQTKDRTERNCPQPSPKGL
jgi:transposase